MREQAALGVYNAAICCADAAATVKNFTLGLNLACLRCVSACNKDPLAG
jgi:hypothetical protein